MASNVLITHHDPEEGDLLQHALAGAGFEVFLCHDAMSTLARTKKHKPDLLVVADDLPDATGFDLCDSVRRKSGFSRVPMVILVAPSHFDAAQEHRSGSSPAAAYLDRPVDLSQFLERIRSLLSDGANSKPPPLPGRTSSPTIPAPSSSNPDLNDPLDAAAAAAEAAIAAIAANGHAPTPSDASTSTSAPTSDSSTAAAAASNVLKPPPLNPAVALTAPVIIGLEAIGGLPSLPPIGLPPSLPPLPEPEPVKAEGDPFNEPSEPRPPKSGAPEEKVTYFRSLVKAKDETLLRARAVYAQKQNELLALHEKIKLRERELGDMAVQHEAELLGVVRSREAALLEQVRVLSVEVDKVRNTLETAAKEERKQLLEHQRKEVKARDGLIRQLEQALENANRSERELQAQLAAEQSNASETAKRLEHARQRVSQLEASIAQSAGSLGNLERELTETRKQLLAQEVAANELTAQREADAQKLAEAQRQLTEANERNAEHERHASRLELHLAEQSKRADVAEHSHAQAQERHRSVSEELANVRTEFGQLREQHSHLGQERDALEQSRSDLEHRHAQLLDERGELLREQAQLRTDLEDERKNRNESVAAEAIARKHLEEVGAARARVANELAQTQKQLSQTREERDQHAHSLGESRTRVESLEQLLQQLGDKLTAAKNETEQLQNQIATLEGKLAGRDSELAETRRTLETRDIRIRELREALEIEELQTRALREAQTELESTKQRVAEQQMKLAEAEANRKQLDTLRARLPELDAAKKQLVNLEGKAAELEVAKKQIETLKAQIDELGAERKDGGHHNPAASPNAASAANTTLGEELAAQGKELLEARLKVSSLELNLAELTGISEAQAEQLTRVESQLTQAQAETSRLQAALAVEREAREAESRNASSSNRNSSAAENEAKARSRYLEKCLTDAETRVTEAKSKLQAESSAREALEKRVSQLQRSKAEVEQRLREVEHANAEAQAEQTDRYLAKGRVEELERALAEVEERLQTNDQAMRALSESHESQLLEADQELAVLENQWRSSQSQISTLEAELFLLREQAQQVRTPTRDSGVKEHAQLQAELKRVREELEKTRAERDEATTGWASERERAQRLEGMRAVTTTPELMVPAPAPKVVLPPVNFDEQEGTVVGPPSGMEGGRDNEHEKKAPEQSEPLPSIFEEFDNTKVEDSPKPGGRERQNTFSTRRPRGKSRR